MFFNGLIRSLYLSYLPYSLFSSNIIKSQMFIVGIIFAIVLILIPIALGSFLLKNLSHLDSKQTRTKYEKLYTDILLKKGGKLKILFYPWFLLKRVVLVLIPLQFKSNISFQIIALINFQVLNIIVCGVLHPYAKLQQRIELTNEFMISVLAVLTVSFTPFCQSYEASFQMGYVFLGVKFYILFFNFGLNTCIIISKYR